MHKTEPKIVAPGYTDEEIYEWMTKKLAAALLIKSKVGWSLPNPPGGLS